MSDDDLEARLRGLSPAELPSDLQQRLAAAPLSSGRAKIRWIWIAAPFAAAAVVVFALLPKDAAPVAPKPKPKFRDLVILAPVEERSTLVQVRDLGVVATMPSRPVRLVQYTWVDHVTYRAADGTTTVSRAEPREEIVPIVLQAF
jgi:hypothetical protein